MTKGEQRRMEPLIDKPLTIDTIVAALLVLAGGFLLGYVFKAIEVVA